MKREGFDVQVATDGATALQIVERDLPDLVVLDVMLPRRDGYDVCKETRDSRPPDGARIRMLSANGRELDRRKGLALGADDYVPQTFTPQELTDSTRARLGL